jgi:hypothetical protein
MQPKSASTGQNSESYGQQVTTNLATWNENNTLEIFYIEIDNKIENAV